MVININESLHASFVPDAYLKIEVEEIVPLESPE
jgi:hypothetical protein